MNPFLFPHLPPHSLPVVWAHCLNSSWSAVNNVLHPWWLNHPPCVIRGLSRLPVASRQGGFREQLHHRGQQIRSTEHGGGGCGLHVQVPHHTLCLDHTWAPQPREPGEWFVKLCPSASLCLCLFFHTGLFGSSLIQIFSLSFTYRLYPYYFNILVLIINGSFCKKPEEHACVRNALSCVMNWTWSVLNLSLNKDKCSCWNVQTYSQNL